MRRNSAVVLLSISLLCVSSLFAQQAKPNQEQISVITFMGEVNGPSMNQLLTLVNSQVRSGVHKIRLVISSGGGDPSAAFAAYNYLRSLAAVEISTYNVGNVDSAAVILYCAGQNRYSFPATRFLIHGNAVMLSANMTMDAAALQGNVALLTSLNQMTVQVISATVKKSEQTEIENAVRGQRILTPDEAIKWGLVQEIKTNFMEGGATLVSVNTPPSTETTPSPIKFTSITQTSPYDWTMASPNTGSCGIVPIKPIPPIGCKDLRAECVCDANGNNCRWEWVCIPN